MKKNARPLKKLPGISAAQLKSLISAAKSAEEKYSPHERSKSQVISTDDFLKKLLSLDPPWKHLPDVAGEARRTLEKQSDAQLIELFMKGNSKAFDRLVVKYRDMVERCILYRVYDKDDMKDIRQNTFLSALLDLREGKYHEEQNFAHWLKGIARHESADWIRRRELENKVRINLKWKTDNSRAASRRHGISNAVLAKAVRQLSPQMQAILNMHFLKHLSFRRIAEIMTIKIGAVTSAYSKALKKLKVLLKPYEWGY